LKYGKAVWRLTLVIIATAPARSCCLKASGKHGLIVRGFTLDTIGNPRITEDHGVGNTNFWEVIPETLGQYTEIKDKNDVKIFEGDIVERKNINTFPVIYDDGCFSMNYAFGLNVDAEFEVIGNIHDTKPF
jgi:hypothetical protein